jgi:glycosyltransferase involved in cell wall biosynthesis
MADILHLYGNWKWTGPTELAVHLAESQQLAGHRVRMAFGRQRGADDHFTIQTQRRKIARVEGFELAKHIEIVSLIRDARRLANLMKNDPPQIIHCHLPSDHLVVSLMRKFTKNPVPVVRSTYEPYGPSRIRRERFNLRYATDRLVLPCESALASVVSEGRFAADRCAVVEPAIDTLRFGRERAVPDARAKLGIPAGAFVLGIVARVQAKRRFDVFLEVARRLCERDPGARVVILGGGTNQYIVARKPAEDMGLKDRILFPGVLRADEYVAALRTFDVKCYMVPGTDGTCRAVKEAMCSGVPVVVANVGMLPDLVKHNETGLVFDGTVDGLDRAVESLRKDPSLRRRLAQACAVEAQARWRRSDMEKRIEAVYQTCLQTVP